MITYNFAPFWFSDGEYYSGLVTHCDTRKKFQKFQRNFHSLPDIKGAKTKFKSNKTCQNASWIWNM